MAWAISVVGAALGWFLANAAFGGGLSAARRVAAALAAVALVVGLVVYGLFVGLFEKGAGGNYAAAALGVIVGGFVGAIGRAEQFAIGAVVGRGWLSEQRARWASGVLAVVVVAAVAWSALGKKDAVEDKKQEVGQVEKVADVAACECRNGAWCEGPQGGIYCLTAEGKKRYKAKQ